MVSSCLMLGCTSSTSTKGLSFHRFPKDPKLKSLWVAATRRHKWEPTKWSRICGAHFSPNNYKNNKLLAGSVREGLKSHIKPVHIRVINYWQVLFQIQSVGLKSHIKPVHFKVKKFKFKECS